MNRTFFSDESIVPGMKINAKYEWFRAKMRVSLLGGARELVNNTQKPCLLIEFIYKSRKRVYRLTELSKKDKTRYTTGANK